MRAFHWLLEKEQFETGFLGRNLEVLERNMTSNGINLVTLFVAGTRDCGHETAGRQQPVSQPTSYHYTIHTSKGYQHPS